jgi:YesN/AraC family two-component response regulator
MIARERGRFNPGESIAYMINTGQHTIMPQAHYHPFYEILFMRSGTMHMIVKDDNYTMYTGQIMVLPPYIMHNRYMSQSSTSERFILYCTEDMLLPNINTRLLQSQGKYSPNKVDIPAIQKRLTRIAEELDNPGQLHKEYLQTLINELIMHIFKHTENILEQDGRDKMNEVKAYINYNYDEDIGTSSIAEYFYMTPYYLCRQFKKYTGRTLIQYLNMTRVLHAQKALTQTDTNITDIGIQCGFSNSTHFYRTFKDFVGISPSEYRKIEGK